MTDIIHTTEVVPLGYHQTNAGILPNEWTSRPLSSIAEEITETAGTKKIETVSISAGIGFVNQAEKFGKELSGKQYEKYMVLHQGDFSYNKGNSNLYPQGCIYRLNDRAEAAVPNVFESFRVADGNSDYYEQLFVSGFLNKQLYSRINRGVRDDGLLNLRGKDFYSCEVPCPPLAEQERIAEILMQCDKVIELKKKRIEEEKKKKKWLMTFLLSSQPTIHFPDGNRKWQKAKLGRLVTIYSGDAPSKFKFQNEGMPYYKVDSLNYGDKYIESEVYHIEPCSNFVPAGAIVFPKRGAAIMNNKIRMTKHNCQIDSNLMALLPHSELDVNYLYAVLSNEGLYKLADTSTIPQLNNKHIIPYEIWLPSIEEQKGISKLFSCIDAHMTLLEQELLEWQRKKKALMQLLLTGIVRTKA